MRVLLDTHLLLWAAAGDRRLPPQAAAMIRDPDTQPHFSAVSIWEVAIKQARQRADFNFDPVVLRRALFDNGYIELPVTGVHAAGVGRLPDLHRDPFDRLLVSQATVEEMTLLTADAKLADYPGPILHV